MYWRGSLLDLVFWVIILDNLGRLDDLLQRTDDKDWPLNSIFDFLHEKQKLITRNRDVLLLLVIVFRHVFIL